MSREGNWPGLRDEKNIRMKKFANHSRQEPQENLGVHANRSVLNILTLSPGFRNFDCRQSRSRIHSQTYTQNERDAHLGAQSASSWFLSFFFFLVLPLPFLQPSQILDLLLFVGFLEVRVATILRSRLFLAIGGRRGRAAEGATSKKSLFKSLGI